MESKDDIEKNQRRKLCVDSGVKLVCANSQNVNSRGGVGDVSATSPDNFRSSLH